MTKQEFIDLLKSKGYEHRVVRSGVAVTNHGDVDLRSLTSLPEGTKFENHGSVDLESLTSLPEGTKFENHGYVYLESLTSLPEGTKFENHGSVDLGSLTSLPEGTKFENHGDVYLRSLTSGLHTYAGKQRQFRYVDGYTMLITSSKSYAGYIVHSARYFGGGDIENLNKCYVAESGNLTAHGGTMKSAIEDLQFKISDSADKEEIAKQVLEAGEVTLAQFRSLTGACREGVRHHLEGVGIDLGEIDALPLKDALAAMAGTYFGVTFKEHLESTQ